MCDLIAAFDTVANEILLAKLELYGLSTETLKLFSSYFEGRTLSFIWTSMEVDLKERRSRWVIFRGLLLDPYYLVSFNDVICLDNTHNLSPTQVPM